MIALLTTGVQHLGGKDPFQGVTDCFKKLEALRRSYDSSHQSWEARWGMVCSLMSLYIDLKGEQLRVLEQELQKQMVLAGTRGHVYEFRLFAYYDLVDRDPAAKEQFPTLSRLLDALQQERMDFENGRIPTRPLTLAFWEAVGRLGLSQQEWQLLKALGTGSVASLDSKFTIEELETVVFPSELEPCRKPLVKAARTVDELRKAMAVGSSPPPSDDI